MIAVRRLTPRLLLGIVALSALVVAPHAMLPSSHEIPASAATDQDVPAGHIVVGGQILYIDQLSDRNHPAAGLKVEIWDLDRGFPTTSEKLGETRTDMAGFFRSDPILNQDRDGPGGEPGITRQDVFLKLFTDNGKVRLLKWNTTQAFVWQSYEIDPINGIRDNVPDGEVNLPRLVIQENSPNVEALWTFVNMAEAWLFMRDATGSDPGELTGFWSRDLRDGPRYDPVEKRLYFRDGIAGYADVVVQHTAYALLHNIYGTLPAGWENCLAGPGAEVKAEATAACALVQGFATYLPLAVYQEPIFESPSVRALDLDAPLPVMPGWSNGDKVPGRIAGAFWDLDEHDQTVEAHDAFNATFADIWEVFAQRRPNTMAEWWAGWKALGKDACGASASLFQNSIDYGSAPTIQTIPDVVIDEDTTYSFDLYDYISDTDCGDDQLQITVTSFGTPEAGVTLQGTSVISVTPQANWFGSTTVMLTVSDGAMPQNTSFRVIVNSVNDCPQIMPRVIDPLPVKYNVPIRVDLTGHGVDVEDAPTDLQWDVEIDSPFDQALTVTGRGTTTLVFTLDPVITGDYTARVNLVLRDRNGCETKQSLALFWSSRPNNPPFIRFARLTREYIYPINTSIRVDLTGVAGDDEDGDDDLEWFVNNPGDLNAQISRVTHQVFDFEPDVNFVGSNVVELEVRDSVGARATGEITLTWKPADFFNVPPQILRNRLLGKTVGAGKTVSPTACYPLMDKAIDPDDPIRSLRWFLDNYNTANLRIDGLGSQQICMTPRPGFIGCETARFIVRDPKGGEDTHEITTCWREIKIMFPSTSKPLR